MDDSTAVHASAVLLPDIIAILTDLLKFSAKVDYSSSTATKSSYFTDTTYYAPQPRLPPTYQDCYYQLLDSYLLQMPSPIIGPTTATS